MSGLLDEFYEMADMDEWIRISSVLVSGECI